MKRTVFTIFAAFALSGCVDVAGEDLPVFPRMLWFEDAPGLDNRHAYEVSGPTWNAAHRPVADLVWAGEARPRTDAYGEAPAIANDPAPYTAGTPMQIRARFGAALSPQIDTTATVRAVGTLRSTTDDTLPSFEILHWEGEVRRVDGRFEDVRMETAPLPDRIDVWEFEIRWFVDDGERARTFHTTHSVPTTWRAPVDGAPLYRRIVLWSSRWAAGEWADGPSDSPRRLESEHRISERLLEGTRTLEDEGRSYGGFPRPDRRTIDDRANVWLDFPRSACGEWRGALMALIETQGIDASWVWFKFPDPDDEDDEEHWHPGVYTHYRTREVSAVGRRAKRWINTNHIVVQVNGRIYDPTYTVVKDSWREYEDWMFAEYCKTDGDQPSDSECQPNPAGYSADDDVHPRVIIADNYR